LQEALTFADSERRTEALRTLAPHLPAEEQAAVWQEALDAARVVTYEPSRADALAALAPHLPMDLFPQALEAACITADASKCARALGALAPHLVAEPAADLQQLQMTLRMAAAHGRAALLRDLSALMPWLIDFEQRFPSAIEATMAGG